MGWNGSKRWTQEISDVSSSTDYMNATVTIVDPAKVVSAAPWDIDSNTPPVLSNNGLIVSGIAARINWPLRAVNDPGTVDADPDEIRPGRMVIRWSDYDGPLRTGLQVYVSQGGDHNDLNRYVFRIAEAMNSSNVAGRVMKISVEGESGYGPVIPT